MAWESVPKETLTTPGGAAFEVEVFEGEVRYEVESRRASNTRPIAGDRLHGVKAGVYSGENPPLF